MIDFFKKSGWVLLSNLSVKFFSFLQIALITYFIIPEDLAVYNAINISILSTYLLSTLGVPVILQRSSALNQKSIQERLGSIIVAGGIIMTSAIMILLMIYILFRNTIGQFIIKDSFNNYYIEFIVGLILYFISQLPLYIIQGLGEFKLYSIRNLVSGFITLIFVFSFAAAKGLNGAILGMLISYFFNAIISIYALKLSFLKSDLKLKFQNVWSEIKYILKEGFTFYFGNTFFGSVTNIVLIGFFTKFIGVAEYSYFRLGQSLVSIISVIPNAVRPVLLTFVAKLGEKAAYLKSFQARTLFLICIVTTILISINIELIVKILFDDKYLPGIYIYTLLLIINLPFIFYQIYISLFVGEGRLFLAGITATSQSLLFLILLLISGKYFSINFYGLIYSFTYLFSFLILFVLHVKLYSEKALKNFLIILILTLIYCASILIYKYTLFIENLVLINLISLVIYIVLFFFSYSNFERERIYTNFNRLLQIKMKR